MKNSITVRGRLRREQRRRSGVIFANWNQILSSSTPHSLPLGLFIKDAIKIKVVGCFYSINLNCILWINKWHFFFFLLLLCCVDDADECKWLMVRPYHNNCKRAIKVLLHLLLLLLLLTGYLLLQVSPLLLFIIIWNIYWRRLLRGLLLLLIKMIAAAAFPPLLSCPHVWLVTWSNLRPPPPPYVGRVEELKRINV